MDRDPDNANPTVLSASQLPTRQKKRSPPKTGPENLLDEVIYARPWYLRQPFCDDDSLWSDTDAELDNWAPEPIDEQEIYDLISTISDPEHPLSLGQLAVVNLPDIHISPPPQAGAMDPNRLVEVLVELTPTVSHCSLATVLGLGVRVRLEKALPPNWRVDVRIKEKAHAQDDQVNKQLSDKERVAAALENNTLKGVLEKMLETCA